MPSDFKICCRSNLYARQHSIPDLVAHRVIEQLDVIEHVLLSGARKTRDSMPHTPIEAPNLAAFDLHDVDVLFALLIGEALGQPRTRPAPGRKLCAIQQHGSGIAPAVGLHDRR